MSKFGSFATGMADFELRSLPHITSLKKSESGVLSGILCLCKHSEERRSPKLRWAHFALFLPDRGGNGIHSPTNWSFSGLLAFAVTREMPFLVARRTEEHEVFRVLTAELCLRSPFLNSHHINVSPQLLVWLFSSLESLEVTFLSEQSFIQL